MYRIVLVYDDNLYKEPQGQCRGCLEFETARECFDDIVRIIDIQDTLIERHCCYNPYTRIAMYRDNDWLCEVIYTYRKGIHPENNRNFRKEIKAKSEHYYREIQRQVHNRDI